MPYPPGSGQSQRVLYTLRAAREKFHVIFLTFAAANKVEESRKNLASLCDEIIILPSIANVSLPVKAYHRIIGKLYSVITGLKVSNYLIGEVEFSPSRIEKAIAGRKIDLVIFEYFHAFKATGVFRKKNIPTILDTHNVLWRTYIEQVLGKKNIFSLFNGYYLKKYKNAEEKSWNYFDYVIAINKNEYAYIQSRVSKAKTIYLPMGIDFSEWEYSFNPGDKIRLAYYGGMSADYNQRSAMTCVEKIMPLIWKKYPEAEFWIIGSKPPEYIRNLEKDPRIHVTGFVEKVSEVLSKIDIVLCPWQGTYGFRSRLVEVMSLGIPVIASTSAVDGMDFTNGKGIFLKDSDEEMAAAAIALIDDSVHLEKQSRMAREEVLNTYSYEATYKSAMNNLYKELGFKE